MDQIPRDDLDNEDISVVEGTFSSPPVVIPVQTGKQNHKILIDFRKDCIIKKKFNYMYSFNKFPLQLYHFNKFPFKITDNIPFVTNPAGGEIIATTFRRTQLPNGGFTISRAPLDSGEKVT